MENIQKIANMFDKETNQLLKENQQLLQDLLKSQQETNRQLSGSEVQDQEKIFETRIFGVVVDATTEITESIEFEFPFHYKRICLLDALSQDAYPVIVKFIISGKTFPRMWINSPGDIENEYFGFNLGFPARSYVDGTFNQWFNLDVKAKSSHRLDLLVNNLNDSQHQLNIIVEGYKIGGG